MKNKSIVEEDIQQVIKALGKSLFILQGKSILITGASGMIASYIIRALIYANSHIFKEPAKLFLQIRKKRTPFGKDKNIVYLHGDIGKKSLTVKKVNYIIHAASKAAPKDYLKNRVDTLNTNILGLYNLLKLDRKDLKSFVFVSSAELYGDPGNKSKVSEEYFGAIDHLSERSCYVEGKKAAEAICMNYFWEEKLPVKIVRLFHTFGPGLNINDGRVFSDFIKNGLEEKNIEVRGDIAIKRSLLYLADATIMILKVLLSQKNGEVYNIGNDKNIVTVGSFAKIVQECINSKLAIEIKVIHRKRQDNTYRGAVSSIIPNINKFTNEFDYSPQTDIKEAVRRTATYYLSIEK